MNPDVMLILEDGRTVTDMYGGSLEKLCRELQLAPDIIEASKTMSRAKLENGKLVLLKEE